MALMDFETLSLYQPRAGTVLKNGFAMNRLSHAYIFEGPRGTKKLETAFFFAKRLLCQHPTETGDPCNACTHCKRIMHASHPNVFLIEADGEVIKVDQIRRIVQEFAKASLEDVPRVYIVNDAHKLNPEAGNTLLKTLEEPGADIYAVLVTDSFNALLKTIASRSQVIHFTALDKDVVRADLVKSGVDPTLAMVIPEYTNNFDEACRIGASETMSAAFRLVLELFEMAGKPKKSMVLAFREKRDELLPDKDAKDFFLTIMILYQKDLLNAKLRRLDQIVYRTEAEKLQRLAETVTQKTIQNGLERMLSLKSRLRFNINSWLAFDSLLANLERGFLNAI